MNREISATGQLGHRLDQLKNKLQGFAIIDLDGRFVGEVNDLILNDQQRLHLVVSQPDVNDGQRFFLIPSRVVSWVRSRSRTLSVTLTQATIRNLPDYHPSIYSAATDLDEQTQEVDLTSLEGLEDQPIPAEAQGLLEHTATPKAMSGEVTQSGHPTLPNSMLEDVVQEESIRLLEERLAVTYNKQKVGEVIVRKEIETRMIEVPVRREKLIVEQISPTYKQLAEIDLGQGEIDGLELRDYQSNHSPSKSDSMISGEFSSPKTAAWLLDSIAHQAKHGCKKIRIEIELDDSSHLDLYQDWFDRCSIRQKS